MDRHFAPRLVALAVAVALVAHSPSAAATDKQEAAKAFAEGQRLFEKGDYKGAIAAFERSNKLFPHFLTVCNIARCHERKSDYVHAYEWFDRCLKVGGAMSNQAAQVREALARAKAQLAWVKVESPGDGGRIFVDGVPRGKTPLRIPVNPGTHKIEVRRGDLEPESEQLTVKSGDERTLVLRLDPTPPPIKDKPLKKRRRRGFKPLWFWISVAVTGGLLATTAIIGGLTLKANSDYEAAPTKDSYDKVIDFRLVTNIFLGVAATAGVASTVLFFFTDFGGRESNTDSDEDSLTFGVGIRGRF